MNDDTFQEFEAFVYHDCPHHGRTTHANILSGEFIVRLCLKCEKEKADHDARIGQLVALYRHRLVHKKNIA